MDERDLYHMFDQIKLSPERETAMLHCLLEEERNARPMKKKRSLTVMFAAAVLLLACAFTAMTRLDLRLLDYWGIGLEEEPLLSPAAVPVDVSVTDNGATLHVQQILIDRFMLIIQAEFIAPEGMILDRDPLASSKPVYPQYCFSNPYPSVFDRSVQFIDHNGNSVMGIWSSGYTDTLPDDDPSDNRISMIWVYALNNASALFDSSIQALWLPAQDFLNPEDDCVLLSGDWSCEIPLPQLTDPGWRMEPGCQFSVDGSAVTIEEVYLSPMTLALRLRREATPENQTAWEHDTDSTWLNLLDTPCILTARDGKTVSASTDLGGGVIGSEEQTNSCRLDKIIDPAQFQGGTLTLHGQTFSLEGLTPVAP